MTAPDTTSMSATSTPLNPSMSKFTCNACKSNFENSASQRMHFKTDLHVINVKRQLESSSLAHPPSGEVEISGATETPPTADSTIKLPAFEVSAPTPQYQRNVAAKHDDASDWSHVDELELSAYDDEAATPPIFDASMCLFCVHHSSDLDENLVHMQSAHSLSIPKQERLFHLESFLHYLFSIICQFNECIYCGVMKGSVKGAQQHMLTKGHCKISQPEKGSDYRDFYDFSDVEDEGGDEPSTPITEAGPMNRDNLVKSTENFVRLSSGKTLGHRSTARTSRQDSNSQQARLEKSSRSRATINNDNDTTSLSTLTEGSKPRLPIRSQLTTRSNDEKGLVGVPDWQRRALRATEKRIAKVEIRARNRYEANVQRAADERPDLRSRWTTRVGIPSDQY